MTVALVVPEMASFPDNWVYVHDPTVRMGRIQNFGRWSPYMVKDGRTCLGLEYFVFEGDDLWSMADDDLVEMGKREIGALGLVDPATVEAGYVVRMPKAYPYYDADYKRNVETSAHLVGCQRGQCLSCWSQWDAPLQQPGPLHVHGHADGREPHGRVS